MNILLYGVSSHEVPYRYEFDPGGERNHCQFGSDGADDVAATAVVATVGSERGSGLPVVACGVRLRLLRLDWRRQGAEMASLPPSPQGWVALSPPRTPVLRYQDVASDARPGGADSALCAEKGSTSILESGCYEAARVHLSSQLSAIEAHIAGLETAAHRTFGSAVDRYHHLIVRRIAPDRALALLELRSE